MTRSHTQTHICSTVLQRHIHTDRHSVDKSSGLKQISVGAEAQDLPLTGCVAGESVWNRSTPRSIAAMDFSISTHKCLHTDTGGNHEAIMYSRQRKKEHIRAYRFPESGRAPKLRAHTLFDMMQL